MEEENKTNEQGPATVNEAPVKQEEKKQVSDEVKNRINIFLSTNSSMFSPENIPSMRRRLEACGEEKVNLVCSMSFKNPTNMALIAFFLGGFGVDRFMLGDSGLGVLKILTCSGAGIWGIIDIFTAPGRTRKANDAAFNQAMGLY